MVVMDGHVYKGVEYSWIVLVNCDEMMKCSRLKMLGIFIFPEKELLNLEV